MNADNSIEVSLNERCLSDCLDFYHAIGMFIGTLISKGMNIESVFSSATIKQLLGIDVEMDDLKAIEPEFYNSLLFTL
jgi:hypothetical protein